MSASFWPGWGWLLRFWTLLVATTFVSPAAFAYDGKNQTAIAYDSSGGSVLDYDAVCVLAPPTESKTQQLGVMSPLPNSSNSLPQRKHRSFGQAVERLKMPPGRSRMRITESS